MSLHRVASIESWDRERRGLSPSAVEHRKFSFNPVGEPPVLTEDSIPAFVVPKAKRVTLACTYCLFAAGIVFGYAALKPVLVSEGVYHELCTPDDPGSEWETCYHQEIRLNLMFTIAAVATNIAALPVGTILDKFGPKITGFIGSLLLAIGSIFMIFAPEVPFDGYIPGYLFLALGGPFIFISSFQLSNCFPKHSGLILALITGAFDSSSAVFLVYRLAYTASHHKFNLKFFFTVYLIVPVFTGLVQIFIMPKESYQTVGEMMKAINGPLTHAPSSRECSESQEDDRQTQSHAKARRKSTLSELTPLLGGEYAERVKAEEEQKRRTSLVWGVLHGFSAIQQIRTPWWILMALFVMIQMTRINYFVATIRAQYSYLFQNHAKAVRINNVFDILLPAGGVLSVPFIGLILDNSSVPLTLGLLVSMATTIGILGVLPFEPAAYANIALFVLYRPFYYTAVSDYSAKVFGFHTFGKVYGLIICVSGLFNFSQSGLDALTYKTFAGNPVPINIVLLGVAFVVGIAFLGYVNFKSTIMNRGQDLRNGFVHEEGAEPGPSTNDNVRL